MLDSVITTHYKFQKLLKYLENSRTIHLTGLTGAARSFFVSKIIKNVKRPILLVTPDISTALKYTREIRIFSSKKTSFLPSQEASPYEQVYSDPEITKQQLIILKDQPEVIVTPAKNLLNTYLPKQKANDNSVKLGLKAKADPFDTAQKLTEIGYKRVTTVIDPGEFSLRGDILDIYPISGDPVRVEFFCDEVESLRLFNIDSQRSIRKITSIIIEPRYKIVINNEEKESLLKKLSQMPHSPYIENFIARFEADTYTEGIEYLAPLLNDNLSDVFDYLQKNTLVFMHESAEILQRLHIQDEKYIHEYEKNINECLSP